MPNLSNELNQGSWGNEVEISGQEIRGRSPKYNGYGGTPKNLEGNAAQNPKFKNNSNKVVIHNVPSRMQFQELDVFLNEYGSVVNIEKLNTRDGPTQVIQVTYTTPDSAMRALTELNNIDVEGNTLRTEKPMERRRPVGSSGNGLRNMRGLNPGGFVPQQRATDLPLRILVANEMVGAIIGRQGSTIRQITQQTRARVDVHRRDNLSSMEKSITIYGNPENCTNACKKILEVMQNEASANSKPEIVLKMMAHNSLIGRIIGKGGATIKKIMESTDTKITVSSLNEINNFNAERIIIVRGTIDNMAKAESLISAKLRQSYENDMQSLAPQAVLFPGLTPMAMMATQGLGYQQRSGLPNNYQPPMYGAPPAQYGAPPIYQPGPGPAPLPVYAGVNPEQQEVAYLYIPNQAVGALIGTKGMQVRNMIRFSNASIKIAAGEHERTETNERKVTIVGTPEAQWKAQYMIFEKMREEGFAAGGMEDIRMTVEITVPSTQVGRIIGRGGATVRDLQRNTGAIIKLPEHNTAANPPGPEDESTVRIIGSFLAVQSAQRRIRNLISAPPYRPRGLRSAGGPQLRPMEGAPIMQ